jgi:RimJ/RimL family protein N-acetyltransferase
MKPVPKEIYTERLVLRAPKINDAELIFESYASDSEVSKYLAWKTHQSIKDSVDYLQSRIKMWNSGEKYTWVVEQKESSEFTGMYTFRWPISFKSSISYVIARKFWSRGFGTELTKTIVNWALSKPEIYRIEAFCDTENLASSRVLEKIGMEREALIKRFGYTPNISVRPRDCWCYSKVK